jgi:hypothetical protein
MTVQLGGHFALTRPHWAKNPRQFRAKPENPLGNTPSGVNDKFLLGDSVVSDSTSIV